MFKVGDKVRIIKFPEEYFIGCVCEVVDTQQQCDYCCRVKEISTDWECLMRADEIEKVTKGQQLLFSFME